MDGLGTAVRGAEHSRAEQSKAERLGFGWLAGWAGSLAEDGAGAGAGAGSCCWWYTVLRLRHTQACRHAGVQGELREEDRRCVWVMIGRYLFTV